MNGSNGGPLPQPSPWVIGGSFINYLGGVTIGAPTSGSMGPGTINIQNGIYINGQAYSPANYLPLTGGTITGNLTVTGTMNFSGSIQNLTLDEGTNSASTSNKYAMFRSNTAGYRPAVGARGYGNPYVNFADNQFGICDVGSRARDLIGVPFFSTLATYNVGQPINFQNRLYVALSVVPPGAWNATLWAPILTQASISALGYVNGFVNRFRNGLFDIWQRPVPINVAAGATVYTADGWLVNSATPGGTVSVSKALGRGGATGGQTNNSLQITGGNSVGQVWFGQYLESSLAAVLANQTCTFQCFIYNNTGSTFTPQLGLYYFGTEDVSSSAVSIITTALQPCPNGLWTLCSLTFAGSPMFGNGGQIIVNIPTGCLNSNAKTIQVSECDVRVTNGVTIGLNNAPPPIEYRPPSIEWEICQRYYWKSIQPIIAYGGSISNGVTVYETVLFPQVMRAVPTLTFTDINNTGFPAGAPAPQSPTVGGFSVYKIANSTQAGGFFTFSFTANAEL